MRRNRSVNKFILEAAEYFQNRGWENKHLFVAESDGLTLFLSYFSRFNKKTGKCIGTCDVLSPIPVDEKEIIKLAKYVFEHIRPLWVKHRIGKKIIYVFLKERVEMLIDANGYCYPPENRKP